jgi:hypothetical protein
MTIRISTLAALIGSALALQAGSALAQAQGGANDPLRGGVTSMCRVTGANAQGAIQTVRIQADGSLSWAQTEQAVLAECRAAHRLQNCVIQTCRP